MKTLLSVLLLMGAGSFAVSCKNTPVADVQASVHEIAITGMT